MTTTRRKGLKIGVVFPQTEIGSSPLGIREYAVAVERLHFSHILVYDHVVGADPKGHPGWKGPYTSDSQFHEPMVLFGFLASITEFVELVTGIVILPQRQTVLVAKQAAEIDVLSNGRLRLGVGIGWNKVEYQSLGEDFSNRGVRSEEQVRLLRELWTNEVIDFQGTWHSVKAAGLNPLPVQRPIPIWMGGGADAVLRRIVKIADGWFPQIKPDKDGKEKMAKLVEYSKAAGRDPSTIGIEGRLNLKDYPEDEWARVAEDWQSLGVSHLSINTMGSGFNSVEQHIETLSRFADTYKKNLGR